MLGVAETAPREPAERPGSTDRVDRGPERGGRERGPERPATPNDEGQQGPEQGDEAGFDHDERQPRDRTEGEQP